MGNEDEVKYLSRSKSLFLPEELEDPDAVTAGYSLEQEFAATRKNRNWVFYLTMLAFLVVVIAGTVLVTRWVENSYRKADININEFEDLNLKKLLQASRGNEEQLRRARGELSAMIEEQRSREQRLTLDGAKKREDILKGQGSAAEKEKQLREQREAEAKQLAALKAEYEKKIAEQRARVRDLEQQVASGKERLKDGIDKTTDLMDNYKRLQQMKMERLREDYERQLTALRALYNPVFGEKDLRKVSANYTATSPPDLARIAARSDKDLPRAGDFSSRESARIKNDAELFDRLGDRLQKVPYRHSVPGAIRGMRAKSESIVRAYDQLRRDLLKANADKQAVIRSYTYSYNFLAAKTREGGFVVDPRDESKLRVYLNRLARVRKGDVALVFRQDDEYIGRIEFIDATGNYARVVEKKSGKRIEPFDKILIRVRGDAPEADSSGDEANE